jgi:hypothetical protein
MLGCILIMYFSEAAISRFTKVYMKFGLWDALCFTVIEVFICSPDIKQRYNYCDRRMQRFVNWECTEPEFT